MLTKFVNLSWIEAFVHAAFEEHPELIERFGFKVVSTQGIKADHDEFWCVSVTSPAARSTLLTQAGRTLERTIIRRSGARVSIDLISVRKSAA